MKKFLAALLCCLFCFGIAGLTACKIAKRHTGSDSSSEESGISETSSEESGIHDSSSGGDDNPGAEGLRYEPDNSGNAWFVTGYEGDSSEIVIPAAYEDKPVTGIGEGAFAGKPFLSRIELPDCLTYIGKGAFRNCKALKDINLPEGMTEINEHAFNGCKELSGIKLPDSIEKIGSHAFEGCEKLESIDIKENLKEIGEYAFSYCKKLSAIHLPDVLGKIGGYAFRGCYSLAEIELPENISEIAGHMFDGCIILVRIVIKGDVTSIGDYAFSGCKSLPEIELPDTLAGIGSHAFESCEKLSKIEIPEKVTEIKDYTFSGCSVLTDVVINGNITRMGDYVFTRCPKLIEILVVIMPGTISEKTFDADVSIIVKGNHDYEETERKEPTCTETGYVKKRCIHCGEEITVKIPAKGHNYDEGEVTKEPTCTESGVKVYTCLDCGATKTVILSELHHDIETITEQEPSCTQDGIILKRCRRCGFEERIVIHGEHHYEVTDRKEATCTTEGYIEYTCKSCGEKYMDVLPASHNYVETARVEPEPGVPGKITYTCTKCGDSYDIELPALAEFDKSAAVLLVQDNLPWAEDVNVMLLKELADRGVISAYNVITSQALESFDISRYGVVMTANDQGTSTYDRFGSLNNKFENYVESGGILVYGACYNGWSGGSLIADLPGGVRTANYYSVHNYTVDKLHPVVTGIYTDNQSLKDELLKGNYCSHTYFLKDTLPEGTDTIIMDANGNPTLIEYQLGDGMVIASGLTWEFFYVREHYGMSINYSKQAFDDLVTYAISLSDSERCSHDYGEGEVHAPTCIENGYTVYVCKLCGYECRCDIVPALGHSWDEGVITKEPTCTEEGIKKYICRICGETKEEAVPASNHSWDEGVVTKEPTCTEKGLRTYTCTVCKGTKTEEIPALGHNYGEWTEEVPATETKEGVKGHYHCDRCGKDFDSEYTVLESLVIPVLPSSEPEHGETITFGNYHGATEWIVLAKDEEKALILAKDIIDTKRYNEQKVNITWEKCTLRKWLNNEYINTAFSEEERNRILTTHVLNKNYGGVPGGNDTEDKVFLLSIDEANTYFANNAARQAKGTGYAKGNGLWVADSSCSCPGYSYWWLRSPGYYSDYAAGVDYGGGVGYLSFVVNGFRGVRPVLWIRNQASHIHSWDEGVVTEEPTCTEKGLRTYTCTVCKETKTEEMPALGHNYGIWIEEVPATETKEGVKGHYHCDRCGKDFDKDHNILESLVIPKISHTGTPVVGETITFGNYHGATEWMVLANDGEKALIITKDIIDAKPYNGGWCDVTWEGCTLGAWLNNEYINMAFSEGERNRILTTHVLNKDNTHYDPPIPGGNDTEDKVFLLSEEEANTYFADDAARMAKGTDYAKGNGLYVYSNTNYPQYCGYSNWWLRSPGYNSEHAADVGIDGYIIYSGNFDVRHSDCGVRPALWIRNPASHIHSWDEGVITEEPTCTEKGLKTYTCTICKETKTEEMPALGHNYGIWIEEVPATETKEGIKGHYHCDRCGKDFDRDYNILDSLVIPFVISKNSKIGDIVSFGNYHGATEWIVLAKDEDKTLIITKDIIDKKRYNEHQVDITWENCTLRSWLNNEYINAAFSEEERNRILTTHVINNDNSKYGTEGGNDTEDKVFLLSLEEAQSYFADDAARQAKGTDYAKGNGLYVYSNTDYPQNCGYSVWWLRSPGGDSDHASYVSLGGDVSYYGDYCHVDIGDCGVRPVLWICNHYPDEGVIIKEPTCTENGVRTYTCTVCGKIRTEEIPALGHNYGIWVEEVPATETKEGIKGHYHCDRCGKDFNFNYFNGTYNILESLIIPKGTCAIHEIGEIMTFGNYHGATEWIVLAKDEEKTLIITKDIIDSIPYNQQWVDITWEKCTLRKWLNDEYINTAFTEEEKNRILMTHVINKDNGSVPGGNDTDDKVFLLSREEARTYFADNAARMAKGTDYAKGNGLYVYSYTNYPQYCGYSYWWLRSPGDGSDIATYILCDGDFYHDHVFWTECGVRPALWIRNQ